MVSYKDFFLLLLALRLHGCRISIMGVSAAALAAGDSPPPPFPTYNPPTISSITDLPGEEGSPGHLKSHLLVLSADDVCAATTAQVGEFFDISPHARVHREIVLAAGELAEELGLSSNEGCGQALCLERGTPLRLTKHWHHHSRPPHPRRELSLS